MNEAAIGEANYKGACNKISQQNVSIDSFLGSFKNDRANILRKLFCFQK